MASITNFHVQQMIVHESESRESKEERIFTRVTPSVAAMVDEIIRAQGAKDRSAWLRQLITEACMKYMQIDPAKEGVGR